MILRTLNASAMRLSPAASSSANGQEAVVAAACPIQDHPDLFVWILTRTRPLLGQYGEWLAIGVAGVLTLILVAAMACALVIRRWKRQLAQIEMALPPRGEGTRLPRVGEPDLDRIVDAFNGYVAQAEALQRETARLGSRLAQAERFGVLGKLAAQVAHEIRNPTGAMRLKAENALAGDSSRQQEALRTILEQIVRIETQLASLLALTQPVRLRVQEVDVPAWIESVVESHRDVAQRKGVSLELAYDIRDQNDRGVIGPARFDQEQLRRALDNLLLNALRHVGAEGWVKVCAICALCNDTREAPYLKVTVSDNGPGVPSEQREHIFEPFVTGRPDGSGLGLAVVTEVAAAHGGRAWLDDTPNGASFVIEIPWQSFS